MLDVEQRKPPLRGLTFGMSVTLTCLFFAHRVASLRAANGFALKAKRTSLAGKPS
jgi:hypothetical protein